MANAPQNPWSCEEDYFDHLELERHMFAWTLMHFGSVPPETARQRALRFYVYEPPDAVCRGFVFHDEAWHWAMIALHGNMYWRARPDLVFAPHEYRQQSARFSATRHRTKE